ncbi:MAG: NADPH:quinone oxidoreductase family protein [Polyangiales bacterium]
MYRMIVEKLDGPESLKREESPEPIPATGEVAIAVKAIGCNFFDTLITRGRYQLRPELPFAPGAEVSGIVTAVASDVRGFQVGDRVGALLDYGGYASSLTAPIDRVFPIPQNMSFDEAAAIGLVYQTSHMGLVHRAGLEKGETLLVHAAAGGVGLAAVQIGAALGATVIGTAGSDDKVELIKANGADYAINYQSEDWLAEVQRITGGRGVDVVYDPVGGETFELSTKCIRFEGRLLVIGFAGGSIPTIALNRVLLKNISVVGLHWGLYFKEDPAQIRKTQMAVFELYREGKLKPVVAHAYALSDASEALAALETRKTVGKVVLHP